MKKNLAFILLLVITLTMVIGTATLTTHADGIEDVLDALETGETDGEDIQEVIGDDAKMKILGVSKEIMDIVMVVVTAGVIISGLILGGQFSSAGDQPQLKAQLKTKIVFHVLGLIFLANYFGLFKFILERIGNVF